MSQPQELPPYNAAQDLPVHVQAPGEYHAPTPQQPDQNYNSPPEAQPVSEYAPSPTPGPYSNAPVSPISDMPPPQPGVYVSPDQHGAYIQPPQPPQPPPQQVQDYYQQPSQAEYDVEKGGASAYFPPQGDVAAPAYVPPAEEVKGATPTGMITLFGKQYKKRDIIIVAIVIVLVLIFIIGLGAGLGAKAAKNKKKGNTFGGGYRGGPGGDNGPGDLGGNDSGCTSCACFTDPVSAKTCYDAMQAGLDNAGDYI